MKKIFIILFFFLPINSISDDEIIAYLKEGNKIVFIRHALAPGNGDPENFNLKDCSTQRNLNEKGREQSIKIGEFFKSNNIKIDKVLSSEWCRCKDTAQLAFREFEKFDALNSYYEARFKKNKIKQINDLKEYIQNWQSDSNLILVTHYIVISEMINLATSSGELVISDNKLNIIGSLKIN